MSEIKNLGQLIQHLAKKAGVSSDDQHLINVLANADITKVTIHSDFVKAIDENLLSLDAAKDNHPDIKKVYVAQALNALDKKLAALIPDLGLSEDEAKKLEANTNTYSKLDEVVKKLQEKKAVAATEDKSALQKQVDDLLAQLQTAEQDKAQAVANIESLRKADRTDYALKLMMNGVKTVYDNMPADAKDGAIGVLIKKALQDKDAEFDFDESDSFIIRKKDGTSLLGANHTRITPQSFVDDILAQNKVLVVSQPQPEVPAPTEPVIIQGGPKPTGNNQTANINLRQRSAVIKAD